MNFAQKLRLLLAQYYANPPAWLYNITYEPYPKKEVIQPSQPGFESGEQIPNPQESSEYTARQYQTEVPEDLRQLDELSEVAIHRNTIFKQYETELLKVFNREYFHNLPKEYFQSLNGYTGDDYEEINQVLRDGPAKSWSEGRTVEAEQKASVLEEVIDTMEMPITVRTYRGSRAEILDQIWPNLQIGGHFIDNGFLSTTLKLKIAHDWSNSRYSNQYIFDIIIPKGAKAVYVDSISDNQGECEVILQRGTPLIVRGKYESVIEPATHRKLRVIQVEVDLKG